MPQRILRGLRVSLQVCAGAAVFALSIVAIFTIWSLEVNPYSAWTGIGATGFAIAIILIELITRLIPDTFGQISPRSDFEEDKHRIATIEALTMGLVPQVATVLIFSAFLDGGLHFRASLLGLLGYLPGAAIIIKRRLNAPTQGDLIYLKWGWIPIFVLSVPLYVGIMTEKVLVPTVYRWLTAMRWL